MLRLWRHDIYAESRKRVSSSSRQLNSLTFIQRGNSDFVEKRTDRQHVMDRFEILSADVAKGLVVFLTQDANIRVERRLNLMTAIFPSISSTHNSLFSSTLYANTINIIINKVQKNLCVIVRQDEEFDNFTVETSVKLQGQLLHIKTLHYRLVCSYNGRMTSHSIRCDNRLN